MSVLAERTVNQNNEEFSINDSVISMENHSEKVQHVDLECFLISIANVDLLVLFWTERGKRDLENLIID